MPPLLPSPNPAGLWPRPPCRGDRPERGDRREFVSRDRRTDSRPDSRSARGDRPDFRDRGFRADRPERSERYDRTERPQRSVRPDIRERPSGRPADATDRIDGARKKPRWSQTGS